VSASLLDTHDVAIHAAGLAQPFAATTEQLISSQALPQEVEFVACALRTFWKSYGATFGVEIVTRSQFSQSYGLGSSSAVTVATMKALAEAVGAATDRDRLFRLSYETVLEVQKGIGSGFDVAAATYGGTLYFVTGGKVIHPLAEPVLPLVIGYSGVKARTTAYVRKVARLRQRFPQFVESIMERIGKVVDDAKLSLEEGNYELFGQYMNLNQGYLHALDVSTPELDSLISAARQNGAYGAKLSGAGGGDCMIALVGEESRAKVEMAIRGSGIPGAEVLAVRTAADGVRVEPA
jgi:mevalonate kinase